MILREETSTSGQDRHAAVPVAESERPLESNISNNIEIGVV